MALGTLGEKGSGENLVSWKVLRPGVEGLGKSWVQSELPVLQEPSVGPELELEQAFPAGTPPACGGED